MSGLWSWDPGVLNSSEVVFHLVDLWLCRVSPHFMTKKENTLLSRPLPSGVERPCQLINKTIKDGG